MIVDPVEALKKTVSATATVAPTASVSPVPTVVPSLPEYQTASETGNRTLWVVFVVMLVASVVFSGMSWSVPM
ncbi:hypothetical protein KC331_g10112, partial [Hortaea werneckii]